MLVLMHVEVTTASSHLRFAAAAVVAPHADIIAHGWTH
jgi:hypothetical protein